MISRRELGRRALLGALGVAGGPFLEAGEAAPAPPPVPREFRGAWVASVANIDWPSRPGLSAEQQKAELLAILDRAVALRLNAVVFQIRPASDALYLSELEPWSEYLTGVQGQPPSPFYDPLEFAVAEAHRRGLELHAWFNPYRARHSAARSPNHARHISRTRPHLVREYGKSLWLDPGDPEVQEHSLQVVRDVVRRYDIDGVHIDDYFYPYKERDSAGKILDFPDGPTWTKHRQAGGKLSRDDWRRENVNGFVRRLYQMVKHEKRWVKFGISPFGIWRPGHPPQIKGFDQYSEIYADARKWLVEGWVDYFAPQLYWKIDPPAQSYPVLLRWWTEQNRHGRHLWAGQYTSRVAAQGWPASEIVNQIVRTRKQPGATGTIHFSMKALMEDRSGISGALQTGVYAHPALVPASPWLDKTAPEPPRVTWKSAAGELAWEPQGEQPAWLWVLRTRRGAGWSIEVLPGHLRSRKLGSEGGAPEEALVNAVDRVGNESRPARVRLG